MYLHPVEGSSTPSSAAVPVSRENWLKDKTVKNCGFMSCKIYNYETKP
eukprot:UN20480